MQPKTANISIDDAVLVEQCRGGDTAAMGQNDEYKETSPIWNGIKDGAKAFVKALPWLLFFCAFVIVCVTVATGCPPLLVGTSIACAL